MSTQTNSQSRKLKAKLQMKKPKLTRTAFKLRPKISQLLDWLTETTELSTAALFRIEFESDAPDREKVAEFDSEIDESGSMPRLEDAYSSFFDKLDSKIQNQSVRRAVAIETDLIDALRKRAIKWEKSRDAYVNGLIWLWAGHWYEALKQEISEVKPKSECIQTIHGQALSLPEHTGWKTQFKKIEDEDFWESLESTWYDFISAFYEDACALVPTEQNIEKKKGAVESYERILGKSQ